MSKKFSVNELRQVEIKELKKELGLGVRDVIKGEQVVEGAKDEKRYPNLHSWFDWDNKKAAHLHRLRQARELLVKVLIYTPENKPIQAFVSLKSDQKLPGGGYRETVSVLGDKELREELISQAWQEFEYWKNKYEMLKELFPVFDAAKKVRTKVSPVRKKTNKKRTKKRRMSTVS